MKLGFESEVRICELSRFRHRICLREFLWNILIDPYVRIGEFVGPCDCFVEMLHACELDNYAMQGAVLLVLVSCSGAGSVALSYMLRPSVYLKKCDINS